jgi:hypothetical protein
MRVFACLIALTCCGGTSALSELIIVNCTESSTLGWVQSSDGALMRDGLCLTAVEPISNGGLAILDKCLATGDPSQQWHLNLTFFPTIPNASAAIVLPGQATSNAVFGLTFPSGDTGPNKDAKVAFYDIGSRFHGECTGHHNCGFNLNTKTGQISTYWGDKCIGGVAPLPPNTPAPTPADPSYNGTIGFADACGDHMVLQQQPAKAAVYGPVGNVQAGHTPVVEVTVTSTITIHGPATSYTVQAAIVTHPGRGAFSPRLSYPVSWKALLKPASQGGTYTIVAKCTAGCVGSATIYDATFGDVW